MEEIHTQFPDKIETHPGSRVKNDPMVKLIKSHSTTTTTNHNDDTKCNGAKAKRVCDVTADRKAYQKAYHNKPENKAYRKAYEKKPEVKARVKLYLNKPEVKAKRRAYCAKRRAYYAKRMMDTHMKKAKAAYAKWYYATNKQTILATAARKRAANKDRLRIVKTYTEKTSSG